MYCVFWQAVVKPGRKQAFLDFLHWDIEVAKESEPGTMNFDVFDDPDNPDAVFVYEAYRDAEAFAEHQKNEPFQRFRSEVRPDWIAELKMLMPFSNSRLSKV
jgi:quinol monooxygenase YgiN